MQPGRFTEGMNIAAVGTGAAGDSRDEHHYAYSTRTTGIRVPRPCRSPIGYGFLKATVLMARIQCVSRGIGGAVKRAEQDVRRSWVSASVLRLSGHGEHDDAVT